MNGIVNVLKPTGMTSHDVVSRLRKITSIRKIGHAGTLDPNASGVLPVCIGKATRLSDYLMEYDKEYIFVLKLGLLTDTYDIYGKIITEDKNLQVLEQATVSAVIRSFEGESWQTPPIYSALKLDGKKLYEYARQDIAVNIKKRKINIKKIELLDYSFPFIRIKANVTKGTYIRSICHDIGLALGTNAVMAILVRTASKNLSINNSYTLEQIDEMYRLDDLRFLMAYDAVLKLESMFFDDDSLSRLINGVKIPKKELENYPQFFYIRNTKSKIFGIGEIVDTTYVKFKRLLI
ncbi:MAG: tRNA pseudouridine synthase B [Clostridiales bacterium 38_11]|nr:MAG: tRNA pseudouridine synthase B [Clostridiales bacterium 38_11]HBH12875.1 tRNA pseudouridine(55) synthase TruB [Clostridiales bacterium]